MCPALTRDRKLLNDCKQTRAKMNQTFMSADKSAESFSPAHRGNLRTIKHFHGIPFRRDGW